VVSRIVRLQRDGLPESLYRLAQRGGLLVAGFGRRKLDISASEIGPDDMLVGVEPRSLFEGLDGCGIVLRG